MASAQNATVAGQFTVEHPTLLNLGFAWAIAGDSNRNAAVTVQFRAVGENAWRPALPLVRMGGERVFRAREGLNYIVPDGFAGSIPEQDPERQASSIDIYGNDIHLMNDDFVETDGGVHNVRVFNNRGVNAAHGGYSSQSVFGGPIYFYRNIL